MSSNITSKERVFKTMEYKEPDRIPFTLGLTLHGAKHLDLSLKEYFSKPENIVKAQLHFRDKIGADILSGAFYASLEIEAWGGESIFFDDGPPNAGAPIIRTPEDIRRLKTPDVNKSKILQKPLKATEMLKKEAREEYPILGVIISPFSLPIMQMGFGKYIELVYNNRELFDKLMEVNIPFSIDWANAQLDAGADAIAYYNPFASTTIIPQDLYMELGFEISKQTLSKIDGPIITHFASGRTDSSIDQLIKTGTNGVGISINDDFTKIKKNCQDKLTIVGALNTIEMYRWTPQKAEKEVKRQIAYLGKGGGYIISDNHGEIPYQVPEEIIIAIRDAVLKWGKYPLDWVENYHG